MATRRLFSSPLRRHARARRGSPAPATLGDDLIVTSAVIEVDAREKTVVFEQTVVDARRQLVVAATTAVVALFSSFADGAARRRPTRRSSRTTRRGSP